MKRSVLACGLLLLFLIISGFSGREEDKLMTAITASDCQFEQYTLMGWVQVDDSSLSRKNMLAAGERLLSALATKETGEAEWTQADGLVGLREQGKTKAGDQVELYLQSSTLPEAKGTYLVVTLTSHQNPRSYSSNRAKIQQVLKIYANEPKIACTFDLTHQGQLTLKAQQIILKKIFLTTQTKYVEGIETKELMSWSGYSKYLPESLWVGQHKLNLNTAITYSDTEAKTHVLIGSPVITSEY